MGLYERGTWHRCHTSKDGPSLAHCMDVCCMPSLSCCCFRPAGCMRTASVYVCPHRFTALARVDELCRLMEDCQRPSLPPGRAYAGVPVAEAVDVLGDGVLHLQQQQHDMLSRTQGPRRMGCVGGRGGWQHDRCCCRWLLAAHLHRVYG